MKRYCGRRFTGEEIGQLCALIADNPGRTRAQLSRLACRLLQWRKADGGLKEMSCRVAMLRMHREGLLQLPPPRNRKGGSSRIEHTFWSAPQPPLSRPVHELPGVHLEPVLSRPDSALWNEYIDRYHYLGHTPLPGAQLRYFARWEDRILALLGFGAPAWKTAPRDRFIGWRPSETGEEPSTDRQQRPFLDPSLGPVQEPRLQGCWPWPRVNSPRTGRTAPLTDPFCWKPSSRPNASPAPATRLPTGSTSDRPKGAANWTVTTRPICPPKASGSTP